VIIDIVTTGDGRIDLGISAGGHWSTKELKPAEARRLIAALTAVTSAAEREQVASERLEA
jgi:hypothetical protein